MEFKLNSIYFWFRSATPDLRARRWPPATATAVNYEMYVFKLVNKSCAAAAVISSSFYRWRWPVFVVGEQAASCPADSFKNILLCVFISRLRNIHANAPLAGGQLITANSS